MIGKDADKDERFNTHVKAYQLGTKFDRYLTTELARGKYFVNIYIEVAQYAEMESILIKYIKKYERQRTHQHYNIANGGTCEYSEEKQFKLLVAMLKDFVDSPSSIKKFTTEKHIVECKRFLDNLSNAHTKRLLDFMTNALQKLKKQKSYTFNDFEGISRIEFDDYMADLVHIGLVKQIDDSFEW